MSGKSIKRKRHRRWMGIYRAVVLMEKPLFKNWPRSLGDMYDRCYELGIGYELINRRRKMRTLEEKYKREWYGK